MRSCQESYIIWLSFMVHMCKMIISSGIFFIFFLNLIFSERAKNGLKWQKCLSIAPYISRTIYHDLHLWYTNIIPWGAFFIFLKNWFSGSLGGKKDKKWPKMINSMNTVKNLACIDDISRSFYLIKYWAPCLSRENKSDLGDILK